MQSIPIGSKDEWSCGSIPIRAAAAVATAVIILILFIEIVVEDLLLTEPDDVVGDLKQQLEHLETLVDMRLAQVDNRLDVIEARQPPSLPPSPPATPPTSPPVDWWKACSASAKSKTVEATPRLPAPLPATAREEQEAASRCCLNMITGKCARNFGAAEADRFRALAGLCSAGSDEVHAAVRADCLKAARLAACGDAPPTIASRTCPKKEGLCAAMRDGNIGDGYDIDIDAVQRRESFMQCIISLPDHAEPAQLVNCFENMRASISCKHLQEFGTEDSSGVCITPGLLASDCIVFSVGVGYIWQVENEWSDYQPNCKFVLFDPTPEAGPHERVDFEAIPSRVYSGQIRQSGAERHQNILMLHTGIADSDRVGLFKSHFVKGAGVQTAFLTMQSAVSLYGRTSTRASPDYLKLDVEVRMVACTCTGGHARLV